MKRLLSCVRVGLAAFAAMGCGASLGPASAKDSGWLEARSEHFLVRAQLDPDEIDATVSELERTFAAFEQVAYPHKPKPKFTTELVLLDGQRKLEELGYIDVGGVLIHRSGSDLEERLTLVTHGKLSDSAHTDVRALFQHEIAHRFTAFYFPAAPTWLSEGLSELFSTLEIDGERVLVGKYVQSAVFTTNPWAVTRGATSWFVNVPLTAVPSVAELRSFSAARFYGDEASPDPKSDVARMERVKNYAAAWNLVHALLLGDADLRKRFNRYLSALARGEKSPSEAWSGALGEMEARVEREYRALLPRTTRTVAAVPFSPPPKARPFLRPLSPADVHVLLASIRRMRDEPQARLAEADLERAIALDPDHLEARFARAFRRLAAGERSGVQADLARARALRGSDPRVLQLELMLALEVADGPLAEKRAFALSRRAETAAQHALLAAYYVATGKPRTAIRFAKNGIRKDSTCWRCFSALADADVALGNLQSALVAQATAVNLLAEEDPRRPLQRQRLVELEQKLLARR